MGKFSSCIAGVGVILSIGAATSNAATVQETATSSTGNSQLNSTFTLTSLRVDELIDVNPLFRDVFTFDLRPGVNRNQQGVIMDYNPDGSIHVYGQAYGSLRTGPGSSAKQDLVGLWTIDLVYDSSLALSRELSAFTPPEGKAGALPTLGTAASDSRAWSWGWERLRDQRPGAGESLRLPGSPQDLGLTTVNHGGVGMGFLIVEGMPDLSFSSGLPSPVAAVPEPAEWMLMALGVVALLYGCRRLRRVHGPAFK